MVILRGCARCGGDILTGDARNVRCLQCGHRPDLPIAELRRRGRRSKSGGISRPVDLGAILAALDVPADAPEGFVSAWGRQAMRMMRIRGRRVLAAMLGIRLRWRSCGRTSTPAFGAGYAGIYLVLGAVRRVSGRRVRVGDGGEASPAHLLVRACASWYVMWVRYAAKIA